MRKLLRNIGRRLHRPAAEPAIEPTPQADITPLGEPFVSVLRSMYNAEPQLGADGNKYPIDARTRIDPAQGMRIYQLVRDSKPDNTLEIGLGYGFSTVYFLAAIRANGKGHHVAVDPYQIHPWNGVGLTREKVLGIEQGVFEHCSEMSFQGLARFTREKREFGTILIDGDHKFDFTLVDFSLASFICAQGGHIILDDMWMPSIQRVASFVRLNRLDFAEVPTPIRNVALFQKISGEQRQWDHFVPF
jgi:predicted O-methyltransferase YrrM